MKKTQRLFAASFLAFTLTFSSCSETPVQKYKITFLDEDQTELSVIEVKKGDMPEYDKAEPTKASTAQYDYKFNKWVPDLVEAQEDATYVASYTATTRKYTITFVSEGETLQTSEVEYGTLPVYSGDTPKKESTASTTYAFNGWDKEVVKVTGAATYTATFSGSVRKYTIKFMNGEEVLQSEELEYNTVPTYKGNTPTKADEEGYSFKFEKWDSEISAVKEDKTYNALFHKISHGICVECGEFFDSEKIASFSIKEAKQLEEEEPAPGFKEVYGKVGFDNGSVGIDLDLSKYTSVYFALAHSMTYISVFGGNPQTNACLWQNDWYQILLEKNSSLEWNGYYKKATDDAWQACVVDGKDKMNLSQILTMYHWASGENPEDTKAANLRCSEIYASDKHDHVLDEYGFCKFCGDLVGKVQVADRAIAGSQLVNENSTFGFNSVYSVNGKSNGNVGSSFETDSYKVLYFSIWHDGSYVYLFGGNGNENPTLWQADWYNILLLKGENGWKCFFKKNYEENWTTNRTKVDGANDHNFSSILRMYNWSGLESITIKCTEVYGLLA